MDLAVKKKKVNGTGIRNVSFKKSGNRERMVESHRAEKEMTNSILHANFLPPSRL